MQGHSLILPAADKQRNIKNKDLKANNISWYGLSHGGRDLKAPPPTRGS